MKNVYKLSLAAIAASIFLVGCGSDSSSPEVAAETVTGQFVDTYVSGLNYECSSGMTGITNDMGEYTCNVGDTVEFSLGGYVLGSATASEGIVTPETLYPDNPEAALNVAQVIQSLDTDPTDDIITIPENFTDLDDVTVTPEDANFDALIEDELSVPLVTEEEAQAHLDETELMLLLAGKTFYNVGSDNTGDNWIDELVFNADLTSVSWTSLIDSTDSGTESMIIEGDKIIITDSADGSTFALTFIEETADKLVFHALDETGVVVGEEFMFFDQANAEEYYASLSTTTPEPTINYIGLLGGKTLYAVNSDFLDVLTFNTTVTEVTWTTIVGEFTGETGIETLVIDGDNLNFVDGHLTVVDETTDYLLVNLYLADGTLEGQERWYFDQTKAEAYYDSLQPDLAAIIISSTKYFANSQGITGYRNYAGNGSYTGNVVLADGTAFDVNGTYEIVNNVLTINRTSPSNVTIILTYTGEEAGGWAFTGTANGGEPFDAISFATEAERDAYVASLQAEYEAAIVGQTKYFVNTTQGITGYRNYDVNGSYTGELILADGTPLAVSGIYEIVGNVLTLNRTSPNSLTFIIIRTGEEVAGGVVVSVSVDGGEPTESVSFSTEAERDTYVASLQAELEAAIVGQTKYFVNSQGITGYRSYDVNGSYTGELTSADGATVTPVTGTYEIAGNVLTLNRTSPGSLTFIIIRTGEEIAGGVVVSVSVNGGDPTESVSFSTEAERDAYVASLQP